MLTTVMERFLKFSALFQVIISVATIETNWPYLQTYPNVTDERTPLYIAVVLSSDESSFKSIGALPGIQIALDYINREPSFLPGYSLHYTFTDSQVSCSSSSPALHDRERFQYYFQILSSEDVGAFGFYSVIRHFGWGRVGIITQGESLFTATAEKLKKLFTENRINYTEWFFRTGDRISDLNIFDSEIRIYIVEMYSTPATELFCEAYRRKLIPPKYLYLTNGWYKEGWWKEGYSSNEYNCSGDDLASVAQQSIGVLLSEFPVGNNARDATNITTQEFDSLYKDVVRNDVNHQYQLAEYSNGTFPYAYSCYDATLAFAYALNRTITDLSEDQEFNSAAANMSDIPYGEAFTMANFTYENGVIVSRMLEHLSGTSFPGITGNDVEFNDQGTRIINKIRISQYVTKQTDGARVGISRPDVAIVLVNGSYSTLTQFAQSFYFPEGVPNDGTPTNEIVTVSIALTVVYTILSVTGIVFSVTCVLFNIIFKNKRLIRISSPNLNYFIGLGAIIVYLNVITLVISTTDSDFSTFLCNIQPWLLSLGYSFCYGPIIIKMIRICVIFRNPIKMKAGMLRDHLMVLFVLCLGVIDIAILLLYTITEGVRGNLGVKLISNREHPEQTFGATAKHYKYFIYVCESSGQVILYAILFGYKGILQASALLLAFFTRNVKVKGLDDSMYIAASVYVTSIVLAVMIVSTYTLVDYVNVYPAVVGAGLLLGTTAILSLVFIPRMVELYKDPEGKAITTFRSTHVQEGDNNDAKHQSEDIVMLRRRLNELETNLKKQQVSTNPPPNDVRNS